MRAFLFITVVASLFYALDQSMKAQRQKRFAQIMAEQEEARARANSVYRANKKADEEKEMARAIAESEAAQRATESRQELEATFARLSKENQEAQDKWEQEARMRRDLVTLRELTTPPPSRSNPMAVQGVNPRFWATPPPKESTTPAIPQDFEIEERGNFWFGSDGSGGHIRRSPSGRTIYGR